MDTEEEIHSLKTALAGIYFALCSAIGSEDSCLANNILSRAANDPTTGAKEADIYRALTRGVDRIFAPHGNAKRNTVDGWLYDLDGATVH